MRAGLSVFLVFFVFASLTARADDRHAGYYYPEPQTFEVYNARIDTLLAASRVSRIGFVVGVSTSQGKAGYPPTFHMFAKGAEYEKLIIVATGDGHYNTLYRMRALLAALTSSVRTTPLFQEFQAPENLTFLDFCKAAGFELVTITDGDKVAHQITIE